MSNGGYFVTGTDTGIGKTVVSTTLTIGLKAKYWKPIQTGSIEGTDTDFVQHWAGANAVWPESYVYKAPLSPHLASQLEQDTIDLGRVEREFQRLNGRLVVEGAGGVLVPINSSFLMRDLIQRLRLPVIVAVQLRLGCINHTLLTFEALRARNISITGYVSVGIENRDSSRAIELYGGVKNLGHIPQFDTFSKSAFETAFQNLSFPEWAEESLCPF